MFLPKAKLELTNNRMMICQEKTEEGLNEKSTDSFILIIHNKYDVFDERDSD